MVLTLLGKEGERGNDGAVEGKVEKCENQQRVESQNLEEE